MPAVLRADKVLQSSSASESITPVSTQIHVESESCMNSVPLPSHTDWRCLYTAAILETDKSVMAMRVSEAEKAILDRGREAFYCPATPDEKEALDDALYILRALRTAWQKDGHTNAPRAA